MSLNQKQLNPEAQKFIQAQPKGLLIGEEYVKAVTGRTFETINPATGEVFAHIAEADREDIDYAVKTARKAFQGPWSKFKPYDRQQVMLRLADIFEENGDEIALLEVLDNGMPMTLARKGMVPRIANLIRYYAGWATKIEGETIENSVPGDIFSYTLREPIGVVAAVVPWNGPLAALIYKMAPALATGCTLILKPAEQTPLTTLRLGELCLEAGFPPGVVNVCPGFGPTAGAALAEHDDVDKISFTGDTTTGQSIVKAATGNMKRVSLELGGKSPDIVFADADLDKAVPGAAWSIFRNTGQICCGGSRLFVEKDIYDQFMSQLVEYSSKVKIGNGLDSETEMGPLISQKQLERVCGYIQIGEKEGAKRTLNGGRLTKRELEKGYFVSPTIFENVDMSMRIAQEEIFGPVLSVFPFKDMDEVITLSNKTRYGLAGVIWTRDLKKGYHVSKALQGGEIWVNCYNVFDAAVPYGGYKMSGWGRESGRHALDLYTQIKSVWINMGD